MGSNAVTPGVSSIAGQSPRQSGTYATISMLLLAVMGLHWAQPPTVVAQVDLPPPFGTAEMLRKCAFAWGDVHSYFGSIDNCSSWYPYSLVLLALDAVAGPSYGQALVFIIPVILSWLGAFALARAMRASPLASALGAWIYALNPMRQSSFGVYATGEVYAALLPWIAYWIVVAAVDPERRRKARLALAAVAIIPLSILAATPQLLVALAIAGFAIAAIASATWVSDKAEFRTWLLSTVGAGVVASLWWTVPNVASYAGVAFTHPVAAASVAWTFNRASLLNELRFCAAWVWQYAEYNPWSIEFEANASMYASGFVAALWLVIALAVNRQNRLLIVRAFGALALAMLFIAKGSHAPLASVNEAIWTIPGMMALIEPFGPLMIAALALSVCAALSAEALLTSGARARARLAWAASGLTAVALCWNNFAAITGAIFHEKTNMMPDEHIVLPQEWTDAARFVNASPRMGGVVVFPPDDHYQADYTWGYRGVDILATELFDRPVMMPGAPWRYTQVPQSANLDALVDRLVEDRSELTRRVLLDLGIHFAIVRADVRPVAGGLAPDPSEYREMFGAPIARFDALDVYDLGDPTPRLAQLAGTRHDDGDPGDAELVRATGMPPTIKVQTSFGAGNPTVDSRLVAVNGTIDGAYSPIPRVLSRTPGPTTMSYDVFSTADVDIRGTVKIGVWPREPTTYVLANGESRLTGSVQRTQTAAWVTFTDVDLRPGHNSLMLEWPPTPVNIYAAFLTPRFTQDQPWQPHLNEILLVGFNPPKKPHKRVLGARIGVPFLDHPTVAVAALESGLSAIGVDIDVDNDGERIECFDELNADETLDIVASFRDCLASEGRIFTVADARRARLDALVPVVDRQRVGSHVVFTLTTVDSAEMAALPRKGRVPAASGEANGLATVVRIGEDSSPLVLAQTFSSAWVALDATHLRVLPHWCAYGWSNGWSVEPMTTVWVVNLISVLTVLLLLADATFFVVMWCRT